MADERFEVVDDPAEHRYEARIDGQLAGFIVYRDRGEARVLVHTEVDGAFEGRGVGGRLAAGTLRQLQAEGRPVIPECPFVRAYIERHPEYAGMVAEENGAAGA